MSTVRHRLCLAALVIALCPACICGAGAPDSGIDLDSGAPIGLCVKLAHGSNPADASSCFTLSDGGPVHFPFTGGSGSVDGGLSFPLGSAYEAFLDLGCADLDGGNLRAISITLNAEPTTCSFVYPEVSATGPSLEALLVGEPAPGVFEVGSLLPAHSKAILITDDHPAPRTAYRGSFTIAELSKCAARGTLDLSFEAADGGAAVHLTGFFDTAYCISEETFGLPGNP